MLSYKNRFHGHGGLSYVYRHGRPVRNRLFTIKAVPNARRKHSRIAVVVSKKVHKRAVGRNRIRRRLYEQFRHQLPSINGTWDIVCIVSSSELREHPIVHIEQLLTDALSELGVIAASRGDILEKVTN